MQQSFENRNVPSDLKTILDYIESRPISLKKSKQAIEFEFYKYLLTLVEPIFENLDMNYETQKSAYDLVMSRSIDMF